MTTKELDTALKVLAEIEASIDVSGGPLITGMTNAQLKEHVERTIIACELLLNFGKQRS